MDESNTMKINRLPSLTWNWLKVNESRLRWGDTTLPCRLAVQAEGLAPGDGLAQVKTGAGAETDGLYAAPVSAVSTAPGETALVRLHAGAGAGAYSAGSAALTAQEGSRLTIYQDCSGEGAEGASLAVRTLLRAEKNASIRLVQLLAPGKGQTLLNDIGGVCAEGGRIEVLQLFLGQGDLYSGCRVDLEGDESAFQMEIGYLGQGSQKLDFNVVANHLGKKTQSYIRADGTLKESARKLFRGTIDFKVGSSASVGEEQENVLLLGEDVVNQTVPLILCAEEDVQGNHGATIGELSEEALFYFASRGIDQEAAEDLVAQGRLERLCDKLGDEQAETLARQHLKEVVTGV